MAAGPPLGALDEMPSQTSFMALGDGTHELPVIAAPLRALGKEVGDPVDVLLLERLDRAAAGATS